MASAHMTGGAMDPLPTAPGAAAAEAEADEEADPPAAGMAGIPPGPAWLRPAPPEALRPSVLFLAPDSPRLLGPPLSRPLPVHAQEGAWLRGSEPQHLSGFAPLRAFLPASPRDCPGPSGPQDPPAPRFLRAHLPAACPWTCRALHVLWRLRTWAFLLPARRVSP